jgi:hypothetical protein
MRVDELRRKFTRRDLFINLLPREYLPEPEFKALPIVAIVFIAVLVGWLYLQYKDLDDELKAKTAENSQIVAKNDANIPLIVPVPVIQANARFILQYLFTLPGVIELGPDWLNIYIELENVMPAGLWLDGMSFVGGNDRGVWPGIIMRGTSAAPDAVQKVLNFAEELQNSDQFVGVTLRGWQWIDLPQGNAGVAFNMDMGIRR